MNEGVQKNVMLLGAGLCECLRFGAVATDDVPACVLIGGSTARLVG